MKKNIILALIIIFSVIVVFLVVKNKSTDEVFINDHKNIEYVIDGNKIKLVNGSNTSVLVPETSVELVTTYFGNELKTDLNADGREDIVFIVTQNGGGTGTFFYVLAALNTDKGYIGSDGYFLGDRIAPQNINNSSLPKHKNVIVVNYADRDASDAMTDAPHVGKSVYLKLDQKTMQWGIVANDSVVDNSNKTINMTKTIKLERIKEGEFKYYQLEANIGSGATGEIYFNDKSIYSFKENGAVINANMIQKLVRSGENTIRIKVNSINETAKPRLSSKAFIDLYVFAVNEEIFAKKEDRILQIMWNPNEESGNDVTYTFNLSLK